MRVTSFAPSLVLILGRVAGVTNPETNLGGQAVRPASGTVQPSISTERTWLRWPLSQIGAGREDWYQFETGGREV